MNHAAVARLSVGGLPRVPEWIMNGECTQAGQDPFLRAVFDAIPMAVFIVDDDVVIKEFNATAARMLGPKADVALHHRGGDAFGCMNAEGKGCGHSAVCSSCVIRNAVRAAIAGGSTHRKMHKAELRSGANTVLINLLVTATPVRYQSQAHALLVLEDLSELMFLRGLLPICSNCKKIRDDNGYWNQIEVYLRDRSDADFSHGICPDCAQRLYAKYL